MDQMDLKIPPWCAEGNQGSGLPLITIASGKKVDKEFICKDIAKVGGILQQPRPLADRVP